MSVEVTIDGSAATHVGGQVTPVLNGPSLGQVKVPMHVAGGDIGSRIKVTIDGSVAIHGRCTFVSVDTDEDTGYVTYNVTSPMELWDKRPVRDSTGDLSNPTLIEDEVTGPQILEAALSKSIAVEGDMRIQLGTFAGGGQSLVGAPTDWPMTIAELASLLVSTGIVDIVETPIDSGGAQARIDGYNGDYGTDRSGSVSLDYGLGAYNVRRVVWTKDLATVVNKLWYYLGPRVKTAADPGGVQHWRANVTGDDTGLSDPPRTAVLARRNTSRTDYDVRMQIQIFDAQGTESTIGRELYRWMWLAEQWLAAVPRELIALTPIRGLTYGTFGVGDLIRARAATSVMGGFSGVQRIYAYTASWDADSALTIDNIVTSPGNEGLT